MELRTVRRLMPVITVMLVVVGAIVYFRLGCETGCGNVTELLQQQQQHQSAFNSFMSLWSVG